MTIRLSAKVLGCGLLLLLGACQRPDDVVVSIKGEQYTRTPAEMAQGQLTPDLHDADYQLVLDMAMLSAVVYSGAKVTNHRPDYQQDTAKYTVERRELARRGWRPFAGAYALAPARRQLMADGLVYDVWVRPGPVPLAVLVFRGTN